MTRLEKEIDKVTKEAGVELTNTTISKIAAVSLKQIKKAFEAGNNYGVLSDQPNLPQWLDEQKLQ